MRLGIRRDCTILRNDGSPRRGVLETAGEPARTLLEIEGLAA